MSNIQEEPDSRLWQVKLSHRIIGSQTTMILMIQLEQVFSVAETRNDRGYRGTLLVPIQSLSCPADPTKMVGWHALTQAHFL